MSLDSNPKKFSVHVYPTVRQAWGIFGILIAAQIVAAPIQLVLGKESGLGLFLMYCVALSIGLAYSLWRKSEGTFKSLEFQPLIEQRAVPFKVYLLAILAIPGMVLISGPIANLIPVPDFFMKQLESILGVEMGIFHFLTIVVAAAFFEETIFRGIILDGFLKRYAPRKAILYSAFLFALMHMNPLQFPHTMLLGIFIGWIYYRTQSIWPCIWIHLVNNGAVFGIAVMSDTVQSDNAIEPEWWAVLVALPIGIFMLYIIVTVLETAFIQQPIWIKERREEEEEEEEE